MSRDAQAERGASAGGGGTMETASEILERVDLADVFFLRVSGERTDLGGDAELTSERSTFLLLRETDKELHVRVNLKASTREARFQLDVVGVYRKRGPFTASSAAGREFSERVALFAVWPYLRAELQRLCAQLSVAPLILPMIRQGEVQLTDEPHRAPEMSERN